ncbi:MAG: glycoside hydrolase family 9 protein [Gammaproteobacteria bacterium]|nr:glycoside hydrolase family 9 protein [Gammaproteobacteria bacterium]MDH3464319.1 glycoside hydrolase family 9 protein [Gammaproteobacteria bacterium]
MCRNIIGILIALIIVRIVLTPAAADGLGGSEMSLAPIPDTLEGMHPIHIPDYDGVEQLLVLSDRWVIVVTNKMQELFKEIDLRSNGKLRQTVELWENSEKEGRPNWGAYRERWKVRDKHVAEAREAIGERLLGQASFFSIRSPDDDRYTQPTRPAQADRLLVSAGMNRTSGGVFNIDYRVYSYLLFPRPMRDGAHYEIKLGDGKKVSFVFDRKTTVSRAIKVNQVGYLPEAGRKQAYLGAYLYRFGPMDLSYADRFEVINARSGEVALKGSLELLEANPRFAPKDDSQNPSSRPLMYGEDVHVADFTELKDEGVFFISVPGVGRSWPFRHSASVYGPAFYTAARGLYHQRAGSAITLQHSQWTRRKAPMAPYYESEHIAFPRHTGGPKDYDRFDVIGATIDRSTQTEEVAGGWHDAADWDSNDAHYTVVFDLLNAYALAPKRFTDGQLDLPESGNGIPDILDEARYGLEIWRHSMDSRGGVSGMLETWTHPDINNEEVDYAFSQRTRWSSLIFAAAAAQYAQLVAPFDSVDATLYRDAADRAYAFGNDPSNSLGQTVIHAKRKRGRGEPYTIHWAETDEHIEPYLLHAKLRLFLLTGELPYLEGVRRLAKMSHRPYEWHFSRKDFSPWIYFSLIEATHALPRGLGKQWRKWFIRDADALVAHLDESPYAVTWPRKQDYWAAWGNSDMTNFNRALFIAYQLTDDPKYRDAAIVNTDFMFGANPMGMSWTTGLGFVYPIDIQHEMSETDGIVDPVPGITIYGITGGPVYHKFRETVWQSPTQAGTVDFISHESQRSPPLWRRWMVHPHVNVGQNEFTIQETMASTIFTTAMLAPDNWSPDASALPAKPRRPKVLFGRWYLP